MGSLDILTKTTAIADPQQPNLQPNLALRLGCGRDGKTVLKQVYTHYPLGISKVFRLEDSGTFLASKRAYLYRTNSSPGLLAGDRLKTSLHLEADTAVYLLDQSATKVHTMSDAETYAFSLCEIEIGDRATLEYLQEPKILFAKSSLTEHTKITMQPGSALSLGSIMVPGRLARGEKYDFRHYQNQIEIADHTGQSIFSDMTVITKEMAQQQKHSSAEPVLGKLIVILPEGTASTEKLTKLYYRVNSLVSEEPTKGLELSSVVAIGERGIVVSLMAENAHRIQVGFKALLNSIRRMQQQYPLPYSV